MGGSEEGVDRDTVPEDMPAAAQASRRPRAERIIDPPRIVRYDAVAEASGSEPAFDRLRAYAKSATRQLASSVGGARTAVTHGLIPRAASSAREMFGVAARFIAALRSRLDDKPRRKQVPRSEGARAHLKNTRRDRRRYLIVAAMACGIMAAGWGIYLWAAASSEADGEAPAEVAPETDELVIEAAESAEATGTPSAPGTQTRTESVTSAAAAQIQAQGAPLPPKSVRGIAFGADAVPGGEKYVLRMSNPVTLMDGIIESDGFSVTIPSSLSLSRAGPIASAHPDVEHASILNRGDFSELTVRFVAGRHPAYRVEAHGPAIEITIAR